MAWLILSLKKTLIFKFLIVFLLCCFDFSLLEYLIHRDLYSKERNPIFQGIYLPRKKVLLLFLQQLFSQCGGPSLWHINWKHFNLLNIYLQPWSPEGHFFKRFLNWFARLIFCLVINLKVTRLCFKNWTNVFNIISAASRGLKTEKTPVQVEKQLMGRREKRISLCLPARIIFHWKVHQRNH